MSFNTTAMPNVGVLANAGKTNKLQNVGNPDNYRGNGMRKLLRVMQLIAIILLSACIGASARGLAQNNVTYRGKNVKLETIFNAVEQQTGYAFFYNDRDLEKAKPVTVDLENTSLEDALAIIFKDQPLTFSINGKTIVIKEKPAEKKELTTDHSLLTPPPPIDIKGLVTDADGNPLPNASIHIRGTSIGTTTDANGMFTLKGVDENATLEISFVGYQSQTISVSPFVKTAGAFTVQLKRNDNALEEVIVNKGYYTTSQKENTGNVSKVTAETISKQPVLDPILTLEGRVPGLFINSGVGIPGSGASIKFRGQNSIANGNDPFYVIDGVPFNLISTYIGPGPFGAMSPFNILNPADIESVEVLKDADATAIYGSRGANGVILITTKKGKSGKTKLDVNVYSGIGKVGHMMDLLNTKQYLQMRHEAFNNDGTTPNNGNAPDLLLWDTTKYTNWQKVMIGGTEHITNAQATISGGNANIQFLIGADYNKTGTVFPGDFSDQKGSVHFNLLHNSQNKRLSLQFSSSYLMDKNLLPSQDFTRLITLAPDAPALYDGNGNLNWAIINGGPTWFNPISTIFNKAKTTTNDLISNLTINYRFLPSLSFKNSIGYNRIQADQFSTYPYPSSQYPPLYASALPGARIVSFGTTQINSWIEEPQLNFQHEFLGGKLDMLLGCTFQENVQNATSQLASGFSSDALIQNVSSASSVRVTNVRYSDYKYNAVFARVGYNWKEKYFINATARRDGSSRFGPGKQFGNFGAVGVGWIFSNENFFSKMLKAISYGKIRASYGLTGNDQIGDYQYLSTYTPYPYPYQGLTGLSPTSIANPDFGWESVKKFELGLDLGFLKDRILLNASYYHNRTGNELVGFALPNITGFTSVQMNLPAIVGNTGLEFVLNSENIKKKSFKWISSINISFPKNKLISYPGIEKSNYANRYQIGKSLFIYKAFQYTGVDPNTGVYTFQAANQNSGPIYPNDLQAIKERAPKYYGGFENNFTYKSWQIDLFIQFVKQTGDNYLSWFGGPVGRFGGASGADGNQPTIVLNRWQKPGDFTDIQKFTQSSGTLAGQAFSTGLFNGDYTIGDASFIRVKNVAVSYILPKKLIEKAHLEKCRIYIQCQNLFTITNYIGLDPEIRSLGLPPLRTITGGIQITL